MLVKNSLSFHKTYFTNTHSYISSMKEGGTKRRNEKKMALNMEGRREMKETLVEKVFDQSCMKIFLPGRTELHNSPTRQV